MLPEDYSKFHAMLRELRLEVEAYKNSLSNIWRVTRKAHKKTDSLAKNIERMSECIRSMEGGDGK
jgi:hypothetical protein